MLVGEVWWRSRSMGGVGAVMSMLVLRADGGLRICTFQEAVLPPVEG